MTYIQNKKNTRIRSIEYFITKNLTYRAFSL